MNETQPTKQKKTKLQMHRVNTETNRAFDNRCIIYADIMPLISNL